METTEKVVEATQDTIEQVNQFALFIHNHIGDFISFGLKIVVAFLVFLIGRKVIRLIRKIVRNSLSKTNVDPGVVQFLDSTLRLVLYGLLIFSVASKFGLDTASVAALLASAGVAIGLALQGSLSNFAGGILILVLKPFKVGDYIIEDHDGHEGTVEEIQIFYTKLRTLDNRNIVIPNGTLSNGCITNCSQQDVRRVDLKVGISYDSDLKKAKQIIMDLINNDPEIIEDEGNIVFVSDLADSSVDIGFRAWCKKENYWSVRFRLLENVKLAFDEQGIEIPFPQVVVHQTEK